MLLLCCVNPYTNVRHLSATIDLTEELLHIYRNNQNNITVLLLLKILCNLIPLLTENINETSKTLIKNLFKYILHSIDENFTSDKITSERITKLIYTYRTIMSITSTWQIIATQLIFDTILSYSNLKTFENISPKQMNYLLSSSCILGGHRLLMNKIIS